MAAMTNHGIYLYGSHQKACGAWTGVKAQRFGVRFVSTAGMFCSRVQGNPGTHKRVDRLKEGRLLSQSSRSFGMLR